MILSVDGVWPMSALRRVASGQMEVEGASPNRSVGGQSATHICPFSKAIRDQPVYIIRVYYMYGGILLVCRFLPYCNESI